MFNLTTRTCVPWVVPDAGDLMAIVRSLPEEEASAVVQLFTPGFSWFSERNKQEALRYLQGVAGRLPTEPLAPSSAVSKPDLSDCLAGCCGSGAVSGMAASGLLRPAPLV